MVDLEEMNDGISIMDLGLEDYRIDLLKYLEEHPELEKVPRGLQAILPASNKESRRCHFRLKNKRSDKRKKIIKIKLHPYYILYINRDGGIAFILPKAKCWNL